MPPRGSVLSAAVYFPVPCPASRGFLSGCPEIWEKKSPLIQDWGELESHGKRPRRGSKNPYPGQSPPLPGSVVTEGYSCLPPHTTPSLYIFVAVRQTQMVFGISRALFSMGFDLVFGRDLAKISPGPPHRGGLSEKTLSPPHKGGLSEKSLSPPMEGLSEKSLSPPLGRATRRQPF